MRMGIILTAGGARADVELAKQAEAAGFDAVFTVEFFRVDYQSSSFGRMPTLTNAATSWLHALSLI